MPFVKRTGPRPFQYTPLFDKEGERPISKRLQNTEERKFSFERKAKRTGFDMSNLLKLLLPAAILAAIAYFCLIIAGK